MSIMMTIPCKHFTSKQKLTQIAAGIRKGLWNNLYVVKIGTKFLLGAYRNGTAFLLGQPFNLQREAISFAEDRYQITPDKAVIKTNKSVVAA